MVIGEGEFKYQFPKKLPILKANLLSKILLEGNKFIAFAGIGNPEKFFLSVVEAGGEIVEKIIFADHHQYSNKELDNLINLFRSLYQQAILLSSINSHKYLENLIEKLWITLCSKFLIMTRVNQNVKLFLVLNFLKNVWV